MGNGVPEDFDFGKFNRWIGEVDAGLKQIKETLSDRKIWSLEHEKRLDVLEKDILTRDEIKSIMEEAIESKCVTKAYLWKVTSSVGAIWATIALIIGTVN